MKCRHCFKALTHEFVDLGYAPPSNAYLEESDLVRPETYYPLRVMVCDSCWLVQTQDYADAGELFTSSYAYFSSVSKSWLEHAHGYTNMIVDRLGLDTNSRVVELAANDGYLLKNFVAKGIPCLGVEPTASTAAAARQLGVPIVEAFFTAEFAVELVRQQGKADLIIGNNVYAHVPDINNFTAGMKILLSESGTITLEFPHLLRLIEFKQFDTIYHEHFSYLSLLSVSSILKQAGLRMLDVEELSTHGGSLRVYICHEEDDRETQEAVCEMIAKERRFGLDKLATYSCFQEEVVKIKNDLLSYLIEQKKQGKKVVAYGAAAKGNTLLNYAGVKSDLIDFVCDAAESKQGCFMPGSHIPILAPESLKNVSPDVILVLPWNIAKEIKNASLPHVTNRCDFITAVPELHIF